MITAESNKEVVMKIILSVLLLGVFALGGMGLARAEDGKALFQKKMCAACHGKGKKGGDLAASKMDKAAMVKFMKDPKSVNPKTTMPAVKASDAEIEAIADYVKGGMK